VNVIPAATSAEVFFEKNVYPIYISAFSTSIMNISDERPCVYIPGFFGLTCVERKMKSLNCDISSKILHIDELIFKCNDIVVEVEE